ncbi:hypothetical protein [Streptomyces sp. CRN 30]|uniref:hypothetical protein n=1 Tax=Streptomyces sp. CRN 30 TaxID=3075613 RepID=UPI002A8260C0|nr:hypothetical protein [Streptomyces sp. CRN 30]
MSAPTCCGRTMQPDGTGGWYCRKCQGSSDPGITGTSNSTVSAEPEPEHGRAKEPLPIRPRRPHPQGITWAVAA